MKHIALLGGSFNPPHVGHFGAAQYLYETLRPDEIWMLFSINSQKDPHQYASIEHRMAMANILKQDYADVPLVLSDIEVQIGTHITAEVLRRLKSDFPDTCFTWVMGADSLITIHTWEDFAYIFENCSIAVMDRPGYKDQALASPAAAHYRHLQKIDSASLRNDNAGWCLLDSPQFDLSSSGFLNDLRAGQSIFAGRMQDIANYIRAHNLYSVNQLSSLPSKPKGPKYG